MKIVCIGRNYSEHAKELNNEIPNEPVIFLKPDSSILPRRNPLYIPEFTNDLHHEVEIVVRINKIGKHIQAKHAYKYYDAIGLGIDFTARDLQSELKKKGLPWEKAKAFDGSAVLSESFIPVNEFDNINNIEFSLKSNGAIVQHGNTKDMLFKIDSLIEHISKYMMLKIGDLIFTGTPSGVDKVAIGDRLEGYIGDQKMFKVDIK